MFVLVNGDYVNLWFAASPERSHAAGDEGQSPRVSLSRYPFSTEFLKDVRPHKFRQVLLNSLAHLFDAPSFNLAAGGRNETIVEAKVMIDDLIAPLLAVFGLAHGRRDLPRDDAEML